MIRDGLGESGDKRDLGGEGEERWVGGREVREIG